jgi:hypothetical protein
VISIILTVLVRVSTPSGDVGWSPVEVAQFRSIEHCEVFAAAFNQVTADDPDVLAVCRSRTSA